MYLRITKRRNKDGTEVRYYQLAENVWNAAKGHAVAKVVYNFGRSNELDPDELRRLASSILRVVGDGSVAGDAVTIRDAWCGSSNRSGSSSASRRSFGAMRGGTRRRP
jgi:hypothetical protein